MGLLVEGQWQDRWYDTDKHKGRFVRSDAQFRNWVTADGSPGPSGIGGFKAEPGRYHLYVSYACPWAHRTLILRQLKGLESAISVSAVHWLMAEKGWTFAEGPGVIPDSVNHAHYLYEVYLTADKHYSGRVTVPILFDTHTQTIVSNESSEIIRMLNSAFDHVGATPGDFYPSALQRDIDQLNERIYNTVNNGVYKAGFATTQDAYEEALYPLFATLDWLDDKLSQSRYLTGPTLTEADWRLFTTLIRFDAVYHGHFKCNLRHVTDYAHLGAYVRELHQYPGIAATVNFAHIKGHYYQSHTMINPTGVVPAGPILHLQEPHARDYL